MIRFFDILFSFLGLIFLSPLILFLFLAAFFDTGRPLFCQKRIGQFEKPFILFKFRTMRNETLSVASHLVDPKMITKFGSFLRKTKLDEIPQLWNVFLGDMSLIGPRPCLFNQEELIEARKVRSVFAVRPGITGLAQISRVDMSNPQLLAEMDARMIQTMTFRHYFKYLIVTVTGGGQGDAVKHHGFND